MHCSFFICIAQLSCCSLLLLTVFNSLLVYCLSWSGFNIFPVQTQCVIYKSQEVFQTKQPPRSLTKNTNTDRHELALALSNPVDNVKITPRKKISQFSATDLKEQQDAVCYILLNRLLWALSKWAWGKNEAIVSVERISPCQSCKAFPKTKINEIPIISKLMGVKLRCEMHLVWVQNFSALTPKYCAIYTRKTYITFALYCFHFIFQTH